MSILQQLETWSATHHPRWLIVLRVALGLCLFFKGISFINNTVMLDQLIQNSIGPKGINWLPLIISCVHLLGGFLIIIGLLTRWAVLLQIPILIGAVIFINLQKSIPFSELIFALAILLLLLFFFIEGGGPISLDDYFRRNPR